ncbi:MAG TPA: ATP-binding protein [Thermoanaerobaculia bacterium]|jgi:signal transduction histidine kinase/CheY-like chemotaxis protein|nr:ATP-binding protein [Thermoanaerobaculia bacterium]
MPFEEKPLEQRVLVLAPTGRDSVLVCQLLASIDVPGFCCPDSSGLFQEMEAGAGAVILADEALHPEVLDGLLKALEKQPPWSDLPLIVFTRPGEDNESMLENLIPLGNATVLERPVRLSTLISAVKAALRARRRQYEVRDLLERQADADRRKDEFLAMLGHELRNPLSAIRNSLWVLDEVGSREEQAVRHREVITRQTRHLVRMVDDLLDVSRVTLGKIILKRRPVDLQDVAERCLSELGMSALARSNGLELEVKTEPAIVQGDSVRLEQVVCNLVQNAIKYTPGGGRLVITVEAKDGEGVVRVCDTGIGLSREALATIFEPFAQVESSRQRSEGGLGLGLPLVRSLVEMHGGRVEATSEGPGCGSEFVVRLPLAAEQVRPAPRDKPAPRPRAVPQPPAARPSPGLHVLVVEDNHDGRESLRELLELWGHRVSEAATGSEGVEKAFSGRPDVALVDIGLPGLDGNEVARRIRSILGSREISLIAMTGYGQPEDRRRALQAGFDCYLVKPVDPAVLSQLLSDTRHRGETRQSRHADADADSNTDTEAEAVA